MNIHEIAAQPVSLSAPLGKHAVAQRRFQGIPGVEISPAGRLWATWYTGGVTEGPENFVTLATSNDAGRTWQEPVVVIDPPHPNVRAYDPTLWIDPLRRLWLFWAQCFTPKDGTISDGVNGVWGIWTADPDSMAPQWSDPIRIANGVMMNKPAVLRNGDWAYPTAVWKNLGGVETPEWLRHECQSNMTVSRDQGRSYKRRGGADIPNRCFDEHHLIELGDGRIWCLVRTDYGTGQSFSSDGGRTWTPGEDSKLGGPNSRIFIRRLASGRLLLVNHADMTPAEARQQCLAGKTWRTRSHLAARLSDDDGKTWKGGLMLDERVGVSYPDGTQDADNNLWIIYDHERYKDGDILLARFREEDVLAGKCVTPDAALRIQVSRFTG
jgi:hypothetical protein